MKKPLVTLIVCGRFHFHKYVCWLNEREVLKQFIYSYKINQYFGLKKQYAINFPAKEYLMYAGAKLLKKSTFYSYLSLLHQLWQLQVLAKQPRGNIAHFLVHGNCYKIMEAYKKRGIVIIGEVVNVHPEYQEELLQREYFRYGLKYVAGERTFSKKIAKEYGLCDYLLVPSTFIKDSLMHRGISAERIKVLAYGFESKTTVKSNIIIARNKRIKLLYVGQITFRKGIIYLLEAVNDLKFKNIDVSLTLIGSLDKDYQPLIKPFFNTLAIKHVEHIDNKEVLNIMKGYDLLVMPSIEDGFGVVVTEALSVNLPVIATRNCGASERIVNGQNGFVIDAFSKDAIVDAVLKSIEYSFDFTSQNYTWDDYAEALTKFYCEVLNKR